MGDTNVYNNEYNTNNVNEYSDKGNNWNSCIFLNSGYQANLWLKIIINHEWRAALYGKEKESDEYRIIVSKDLSSYDNGGGINSNDIKFVVVAA